MNDDRKRALQPPFVRALVKIVSWDAVSSERAALRSFRWSLFLSLMYLLLAVGWLFTGHGGRWQAIVYLAFAVVQPLLAYSRVRKSRKTAYAAYRSDTFRTGAPR